MNKNVYHLIKVKTCDVQMNEGSMACVSGSELTQLKKYSFFK